VETCYWLQRNGGVGDGARERVAKTVEMMEKFRQRVDKWRDGGFDYGE